MSVRIEDFIVVSEVAEGPAFAQSIFQRKYRKDCPDFPLHVVAFWKRADGSFFPASYVHFWRRDDMLLIGGACTDGDVLRRMSPDERAAIDRAGGINLLATRYSLHRYGPTCDAIFGHCGDARSFGILMRCGFQPVVEPYWIAYWPRALADAKRNALIAQVLAIGPI